MTSTCAARTTIPVRAILLLSAIGIAVGGLGLAPPPAAAAPAAPTVSAPTWSTAQTYYLRFLRAKVPVYRLLESSDLISFGTTICSYLRSGFSPQSAYEINRGVGMDFNTAYWNVVAPAKYLCHDQWGKVRRWM